jgi:hypothetical protein
MIDFIIGSMGITVEKVDAGVVLRAVEWMGLQWRWEGWKRGFWAGMRIRC